MKHISHTFLSFLIFMACVVPGASALTVATEPGGLADAVGDAFGAFELTVTGAVDASDFDFISEKCRHFGRLTSEEPLSPLMTVRRL